MRRRPKPACRLVKSVYSSNPYKVSSKDDPALTYGELDPVDLCGIIQRFCAVEKGGELWDLGSGSGRLLMSLALSLGDEFSLYGGVEIQQGLHDLAVAARQTLAEKLGQTYSPPKTSPLETALEEATRAAWVQGKRTLTLQDVSSSLASRHKTKYKLLLRDKPLSKHLETLPPSARYDYTDGILHLKEVDQDDPLLEAWRQVVPTNEQGKLPSVKLVRGDMLQVDLDNAFLVIVNGLLFGEPILTDLARHLGNTLPDKAMVLSTAYLDKKHPDLHATHRDIWCRTSWTGGAKLNIYRKLANNTL